MSNEDGSVWVAFNGEIWNYRELRSRLQSAGHAFRTRCDTEVLLHGYEEWSDDLLERVDGMFAFALWDSRNERLLLARDRVGKKPLFYNLGSDGITFGSDARAVCLAMGKAPAVAEERLAELLFQRYIVAPRTMFSGVEKLRPAHAVSYDRSRAAIWAYWRLPADGAEKLAPRELRQLLRDAVERRLMSDVPLGVFLSGGVDSAAVAALASDSLEKPLATFTVGFDDPVYDERALASRAATILRSDHHELAVRTEDFFDALPRLAWYRDEPIAEPSEIPLFLLSEFAAKHVKVILSGEGGDELFGGYPKYRAERLLGLPTAFPAMVLRTASRLAMRRASHRQLRRAVETLSIADPLLRWASWFRSFSPAELAEILSPHLVDAARPEELTRPLAGMLQDYATLDPGRRILLGDLQTYLPDNMLARGDKVLMGASLEGRMPLLDRRIVERVARLPSSERTGLRTGKRVLRAALDGLVPREILSAPKRGFPVPMARFLGRDDRQIFERLLLSERTLSRGFFRPTALKRYVARAKAEGAYLQLFTLAAFELWLRVNIDTIQLEPPRTLEEVLGDVASSSRTAGSADATATRG